MILVVSVAHQPLPKCNSWPQRPAVTGLTLPIGQLGLNFATVTYTVSTAPVRPRPPTPRFSKSGQTLHCVSSSSVFVFSNRYCFAINF